ncbi:MAG TPA: chemotaxis protein CheV [Planctomycetaceae bacterium]|nr:chemotaxis protein CheV [Planctomycetaceae bacterium]
MTAAVSNILLENEILLESGTNELEVLVFRVGVYRLGINVAKVSEVLPWQAITKMPESHPSILGCFQLRDSVVSCVSLHRHLRQEFARGREAKLILAQFNHFHHAYVVDEIERIHRISWESILPVPELIQRVGAPITAVAQLDGNLVLMMDFETIAAEIANEVHGHTSVPNEAGIPREKVRILIADDSATVRYALTTTLANSGYTNVTAFEHGRAVWEWLEQNSADAESILDVVDLVVSDVEMPSMDGLALTRRIKSDPKMKDLPVVLYSSVLTPANRTKGESVGADAQITKPELGRVVELADRLAGERYTDSGDRGSVDQGKVRESEPVLA